MKHPAWTNQTGKWKKSKDPLTLNLRPHLRYGMRLAAGCCWWLPQKDRRFESWQWWIWIIHPGLTDNDTQILVSFMDPYLMTSCIFTSSILSSLSRGLGGLDLV